MFLFFKPRIFDTHDDAKRDLEKKRKQAQQEEEMALSLIAEEIEEALEEAESKDTEVVYVTEEEFEQLNDEGIVEIDGEKYVASFDPTLDLIEAQEQFLTMLALKSEEERQAFIQRQNDLILYLAAMDEI